MAQTFVVFDARSGPPSAKVLSFAQAAAATAAGATPPTAFCIGAAAAAFGAAIGGRGFAAVVACPLEAADFAGAAGAAVAAYFSDHGIVQAHVYVARMGSGRDIGAAIAGACGGGILTDVHAVAYRDGEAVATALKFGGSAEVSVVVAAAIAIFVCNELSLPASQLSESNPGITEFNQPKFAHDITIDASSPLEQGEVLLDDADIIVSGGKGLGGPAPFTGMLAELAGELGAALGASRAAVDSGWVPHAMQVGQTGRTVAPRLYIAVGISGQIQHRVGMQSAETIIAINADPSAPIATFSDLYIVGDAFAIVPALTRKLKEDKVNS